MKNATEKRKARYYKVMNCADSRRMAAAWENGESLTDADAKAALAHIRSCAECRNAFAVFLSLAPRDGEHDQAAEPTRAARALADRVMAGIVSAPRSRSGLVARFPARRAWSAAAAAAFVACALFAVGLFGRESDTVEIRFVLDAPDAKTVFLAGDFSSWDTKSLELRKTPDGVWERKVRLRRGKAYSYNFIVDGTSWLVDPAAPERIDDGFGGESALIRL